MKAFAALMGITVVAPVLVASLTGARGPAVIPFNLGPGDGPYVSGFVPSYEIHDGVALHWTTRRSAVSLPVVVRGGPVSVAYRFGPPPVAPAGEAQIALSLGGAALDWFAIGRTERFEERLTPALFAASPTPLSVQFHVQSADPRDLGLWLDWLRFEVGEGAEIRLADAARFRPSTLVALFFALLLVAGWRAGAAALFTMPLTVAAVLALRCNPWLVHQLLTGVPEALAWYGLVLATAVLVLRRRGVPRAEIRAVSTLLLFGFLVRALAVNTPGFYHPDQRSHVQLALVLREAGLDFLRAPSTYLQSLPVWYKPAFGGTVAFPYSAAFHVPLAASGLGYDASLTALKLAGAALSTLPIALVWALARRLGASVLGASLILAFPIYGRHVAVAYAPALFGHAVDLAFVVWLASRVGRPLRSGEWWTAAAFVAACQLAYVAAVITIPSFVTALALVAVVSEGNHRGRRSACILGFGLAGSALAVLAYYRDFLGVAGHTVHALAERAPAEAGPGLASVAVSITGRQFDPILLVLAAVGLLVLFSRGAGRALLAAWLVSYVFLLAGRAWLPDLFQHQHEALWLAPLLALAAGEGLALAWSGPSWRKVLAATLGLGWAVHGLWLQAQAVAGQLNYAR